MRYIDEFRNKRIAQEILREIKKISSRRANLMEVCGTHTVAIFKYGIREMVPETIRLLSGPGCPVCVTPNRILDQAIALARQENVILAIFGDMLKVPGSSSSLEKERGEGGDIRIVYSTTEALQMARENPGKKVVFFAVGFETTSPTIALSILEAERISLKNYFILTAHKLIPPAMEALLQRKDLKLDGFLCPGHVSTIIGSEPYRFVPEEYSLPAVIAGFEPLDVLQSILMLVRQIEEAKPAVEIQYKRSVKEEGNPRALKVVSEVFEVVDSQWRGLGIIPRSGLALKERYRRYAAEGILQNEVEETVSNPDCLCGEVLCGLKVPSECRLFARTCNPQSPLGPCMVSSEGTCAAYYKYGACPPE